MRTAIISGLTHAGKGVLISGKEVPLLKQMEVFNTFRKGAITNGSHPEFKEVSYQENDGYEQLLTFRTPEAQKQHEAARAAEKERHQKQIAAEKAREGIHRPDKAAADKAAADKAAADKAAADKAAADKAAADKAAADKAAADKADADKAAADKAAAETTGNEFKREELQVKPQGELLALVKTLVESKRIDPPAKTSPTALIEAILSAKPLPPSP